MSDFQQKALKHLGLDSTNPNFSITDSDIYDLSNIQVGYDICKKEYEEKLRWTQVEENLPPLKTWVICKHEEIYDTYFFDNEFQMAGCIKRFLITEWRFFL